MNTPLLDRIVSLSVHPPLSIKWLDNAQCDQLLKELIAVHRILPRSMPSHRGVTYHEGAWWFEGVRYTEAMKVLADMDSTQHPITDADYEALVALRTNAPTHPTLGGIIAKHLGYSPDDATAHQLEADLREAFPHAWERTSVVELVEMLKEHGARLARVDINSGVGGTWATVAKHFVTALILPDNYPPRVENRERGDHA